MNSQKGSQRDRIISLFFSTRKKKKNKDVAENIENEKEKKYTNYSPINNKNTNITNKDDKKDISVDINLGNKKDFTHEKSETSKKQTIGKKKEQEVKIIKQTEQQIDEKKFNPTIKVDIIDSDDNTSEKSENIEELVIDAIEQIIREDLNELEKIEYELEVLNQRQEKEVRTKEVEKLKNELQDLIDKLMKIKEKYYTKNNDITIDDEFIYNLVSNYKDTIKSSNIEEKIEEEVNQIRNYICIIEKIANIENNTDEIDNKIDDTLERFEIRDEKFEKMKDEYSDIDDINNAIQKFNYEQEIIIKRLDSKIKESASISKKIEKNYNIVPDINKLIESAMIIALSKRIPPTPRGKLIKFAMITSAVSIASQFLTRKEKTKEIVTVKYTDFSKDINSCIKDISGINNKIDKAFIDIDKIKNTLKTEYGEFANKLDEYDNLMKNLNNVEKELKVQKNKTREYTDEFKNILDKNNTKIKKLESL